MLDKPALRRPQQRRIRTRAALVRAAQQLLAEGRTDVAVLEITEIADVGVGSFYNHFASKEDLFRAAEQEALEWLGQLIDRLTADIHDPAVAYAQSFRMTGRLHRRYPQLSQVLLNHGFEAIHSHCGLALPTLRNISSAAATGRFEVEDLDVALVVTLGAQLAVGSLLHLQPDRDDATTVDLVAHKLLVHFGVPCEEAGRICSLELPGLCSATADVA